MRLHDLEAVRLMLVGELGEAMAQEAWPGAAASDADVVMVDVGLSLREALARLRAGRAEGRSLTAAVAKLVGHNIADVERELILQTLRHCGGNRSAAAVMLGISVRTMRNKLRAFQAEGMTVPPAMMGVSAGAVRVELAAGL